MIDLFALCTHDDMDTMIFVHTNHATKRRSPEGVLMVKASDTDIICILVSQYDVISPREWCTPAVNCIHVSPSQHWRWIPVHELCVGPQKSRGIHAFTNHGIWCCAYLVWQMKEDVMYVKLSQVPSSVIYDDKEILVRVVSKCMTGPAQQRASMMEDRRCLQGAVNRRSS